ncbi:MAG: PEP-CTERM sorting domain-containing protein [Isosphaeraceae bacterium]|nr:PEP-CTERM sorting domain-containing protein [Isosphaeraceae bacterium]
MTINYYRPAIDGGSGGARISATYTRAGTDPAISNPTFIQMVDTNDPLGGTTSPYIDPRPNDDTLPFYWTTGEMAQTTNAGAGTIQFTDFSKRSPLANPDYMPGWDTYWRGELMLASWAGGTSKDVTIYDGFVWDWYIDVFPPSSPAIASSGSAASFDKGPEAVPEPASLSLLAIGGLAMAMMMRRFRK